MANKPNIRFKGFTDDWEQRKLGEDLESIQTGTNLLGSENNNGMPLLKMGNIQRGYFDTSKLEYLVDNKSVEPENVAYYGDFFFNTRNTMELVGKGATWTGESGKYAFNSNIARFKLKGIDTIFFNFLYNTDSMAKQVHARAMGTTSVAAIYPRSLDSIDYCLPCIDEQKRIGDYFRNLDHLITLHQRKCDEIKKLKKFMLQKMFPKNGEKNPEIRFAGFTDDWEQRKVEDIMSCVTDYVAAGSFADIKNNVTYLTEPDYAQLVRTVDLKKKFANTDYVFVDKNAFDYLWRVNLNEDCIVLPNIGANIGEVYYVEPSELPQENNVLGPNAILLKTEEEKYFVFTSLTTDDFQRQLFENVGSSGQPKFNKTELKNISLWLPSVEEQKKIGDTLRNLDHLITLHQRKCDKLKLIKKFMLQNMFPKKG